MAVWCPTRRAARVPLATAWLRVLPSPVREATDIVREYPKLDEEDVPGNEIWRLALHRTDAAIECIFRGPPGHPPRWG
jgi:hypothetical protein